MGQLLYERNKISRAGRWLDPNDDSRPRSAPMAGDELADLTGRLVGLSGQAPKILLIMLANYRPFSKAQLKRLTGMAYRTIGLSLECLAAEGAVTDGGNQGWRISDAWRGRLLAYLIGENGDVGDHLRDSPGDPPDLRDQLRARPGDRFDQQRGNVRDRPGYRFDQRRDRLDQRRDRLDQQGDRFDHSLTTVVVEDSVKKNIKDIKQQQQQSFGSSNSVIVGISPGKEPSGYLDHSNDRPDHPGDQRHHSRHTPDQAPEHLDQPAQDAGQAEVLAGYLRQVGIRGKAYERLLSQPDLRQDPAPVLGWWWYGLTLERVHNPKALAVNYLLAGTPMPDGFLELARWWPQVTEQECLAVEEMLLAIWPAERMAVYWSEKYPGVTTRAIIALKEVYLADAGVLGLEQKL